MSKITIQSVSWETHKDALRSIRNEVFIKEQQVPEELEWDDFDNTARHWLACIDTTPVGCARLVKGDKVGRMAVLRPYRKMGIGSLLLSEIKQENCDTELSLSAQCHAFSFYKENGYKARSKPYDDANIPHVDMSLTSEGSIYVSGKDADIHHGQTFIEMQGYLDLLLSQTQRSIVLCLKDMSHPILKQEYLAQRIKTLSKTNRHFKVYLLLSSYEPRNNEHLLFRLQDRLPSFFEIRQTDDNLPNQMLFDSVSWFDYDTNDSRVCFSDKGKIKLFMERFNQWWHNATPILDARRLSI